MSFSNLFRKKTVQDILQQLEKNNTSGHNALGKYLTTRDLTAFGIAAIVGAGIFSTIGKASSDGGPAVIFLFLFTALACSFPGVPILIPMWHLVKLLLGLSVGRLLWNMR
jgi:APA family basic amino acid/polyamine antiporter